jgi:hypothetical protein
MDLIPENYASENGSFAANWTCPLVLPKLRLAGLKVS